MKLQYTLLEYSLDTRFKRVLAVPTKANKTLAKIIRLPNKISMKTLQSLSYPVLSQDVALVEKTLSIKLNVKKKYYVLEITKE